MTEKHSFQLTDEAIVEGLRARDSRITRDYFYGYCRIAYHIYDRRYDLASKPGMDFYSIAHEYYLLLEKHNFKQLDDRTPHLSLKTWMVNGFRFVLLDRLKAYGKECAPLVWDGNAANGGLHFDMADDNFSEDFRATVHEICHKVLGRDTVSSIILQMLLIDGFKGKEAAQQLGITPSAVTQRFHKLMDEVVVPYFRRYYEVPESGFASIEPERPCAALADATVGTDFPPVVRQHAGRVTPERVESLRPHEVFVFGSNLAGMHGGGTARLARLKFGAILGVGEGPQGQSYAIPTMQGGVHTIRPYVNRFVKYAVAHPGQTFLVTPVGCGLAGFYPQDIAPLFASAVKVDNIHLPSCFWDVLV